MKLKNFFTSGWEFNDSWIDLKSRYQMVNVAILLSSISLIYAIMVNFFRDTPDFILIELLLIVTNVMFLFLLRVDRKYFEFVTTLMTAQFTFFFLFLVYASEPSQLKHIWLFTYPIILLYFQGTKRGSIWFSGMIFLLLIAPFQSLFEVKYSAYQITYMTFALIIVYLIIYFYQRKMKEAKELIIEQRKRLESKVEELQKKDQLLTTQSKQAVMGEMITMIAHQWRQPLSTITLQISNLEVRKLLGEEISREDVENTFNEINRNVMYLSETIDDFQTYFRQDKERTSIEIGQLLDKAVNFILPRLKDTKIEVVFDKNEEIIIMTYMNELIQVVLNLLNNAIDVMSELDSDSSKLIIKVRRKNENVFISVIDNAGGINKSNLPYIFEPYFSTKGKNGTGLGLYMSQMIVQKQFNGSIEVETSSEGANFTIALPMSLS